MANTLEGLPDKLQQDISGFIARLRRRQVQSSQDIARKTLEIMRTTVSMSKAKDVSVLIELVKRVGAALVAAMPHELVIGNMVRRVLFMVREETKEDGDGAAEAEDEAGGGGPGGGGSGPSLTKALDGPDLTDYSRQLPKNYKAPILEAINELLEELTQINEQIAEQAIEHIHANEVILTHGSDRAVEAFLKAARKKRSFDVIVAETALGGEGRQTAVTLAEAGISTTLIADTAVFAMMARVNKVIIGVHAVMANGGLIATAGSHLLALAAQHASVPLVACAGLYKLTPLYPSGSEQFNVLLSPQPMLPYDEGLQGVHVPNPAFDYVPPELVSLFVTNIGGNHGSYIYRLLADCYHQEDHNLFTN